MILSLVPSTCKPSSHSSFLIWGISIKASIFNVFFRVDLSVGFDYFYVIASLPLRLCVLLGDFNLDDGYWVFGFVGTRALGFWDFKAC